MDVKDEELVVGRFYWVIPSFDVDDGRSYTEQYKPEPSRYLGGEDWDMLGTEEWYVARVIAECPVPDGVS